MSNDKPKSTKYRPKLESNHSSQVPPPRQCYSLGGVTIFALPAVLLMPPLTQW